jgi:uncharacterized membrane protein
VVAAQAVFYLLVPALARWAAARNKLAGILGPVVLCYAAGIVVGNLPLGLDAKVAKSAAEAAVPLAIPLLLFRTDVRAWLKLAPGLLVGFALACVAAVFSAGAVGLFFAGQTDEWAKIAGMLVGVYVGGTANMSAVGIATGVREETFVVLNAADVVTGGLYLLVLLTVAKKLLLKFLRPYQPSGAVEAPADPSVPRWKTKAGAFALALAVMALALGGVWFVRGKLEPGPVLLSLTTLALLLSFSPQVRSLAGSEDVGEYVLLIFCVAIGSLANVQQLAGHSTTLFLYVVLVMALSIAVHLALCKLAKLDADTVLITSTATIFGPAFIGPVAAAIKNRELVGPGITLGLAGIALGTYLGLLTVYLLQTFG